MGAYPPGCTQAMHDRAFADETRRKCDQCDRTGFITIGDAEGGCEIEEKCEDCNGTGYETPADTRTDDAYEASLELDKDIDF